MPLRMRVNISAIGSVIDIRKLLPACLGNAGDVSAQRQLPETNPAELKLAQIASRTPAHFAAILLARHELRFARCLDDHCRSCHVCLPTSAQTAFPAPGGGSEPARRFSPW